MQAESKLADIDFILGRYQRGQWSAVTSLAAILRVTAGILSFEEERISDSSGDRIGGREVLVP